MNKLSGIKAFTFIRAIISIKAIELIKEHFAIETYEVIVAPTPSLIIIAITFKPTKTATASALNILPSPPHGGNLSIL